MRRTTIREAVSRRGMGVASGREVNLRLEPADEGFGLRVLSTERGPEIPLHVESALEVPYCTAVGREGAEVYLVEHLMAALCAFGITDLRVITDGQEIPLFDGSAAPFAEMLSEAGIRELRGEVEPIVLEAPVVVEDGNRSLQALPHSAGDGCEVSYHLDHPHPMIGEQRVAVELPADGADVFAREIAAARTFILEAEARALQETGWLTAGGEANAIVVYDDHYSATPQLEGEFARHKILDLLGDLYLLNRRIMGRIVADRTGHAQNRALARKLAQTAG